MSVSHESLGPTPSARDLIDPRIDVHAQYALSRMLRAAPTSRAAAVQMVSAVKLGRLAGIYKEDELVPAKRAQRMGLAWWQLIPAGEDAALVLDPASPMVGPPLVTFRDRVRSIPSLLDPALLRASATYALWRSRRLRCDLATLSAEFDSSGSSIPNVTPLCQLQAGSSIECPCNPARTDQCSSTESAVVHKAFQEAARWLPNAKRKIEDYIKNPSSPANRDAAKALKSHFSWTENVRKQVRSPDIPRIVVDVVDDLLDKVTRPLCPDCPTRSSVQGRDPSEVFAGSSRPWGGTNCYEFYPPFFRGKGRAADILRAKIAIHEMVHSWRGVGDVETYESDANYPPPSESGQDNPDSFAGLIRDLR